MDIRRQDPGWARAQPGNTYIISGAAFVDVNNPRGPLGSPFTVVVGADIGNWGTLQRQELARKVGTPETIFVNALREVPAPDGTRMCELVLTVQTPTGEELGACAHGFIGTIRVLADSGIIGHSPEIMILTTAGTAALASVTADVITLKFVCEEPRRVHGYRRTLEGIFQMSMPAAANSLPVLSVGSPKLTMELPSSTFEMLRRRLRDVDYDALMALQRELGINGIHVFCRNVQTRLPQRCIQTNAYLGRDLMIDRATGVSNAAQVSADPNVRAGQTVQITQYTQVGPSAILTVTKGHGRDVQIGGAAVLSNHRKLD